jgi:hypothetical protein
VRIDDTTGTILDVILSDAASLGDLTLDETREHARSVSEGGSFTETDPANRLHLVQQRPGHRHQQLRPRRKE